MRGGRLPGWWLMLSREKALKLAIEALQKAMKPLAFEANFAAKAPRAANDFQRRQLKKYKELAQAVRVLEGMLMQRKMDL